MSKEPLEIQSKTPIPEYGLVDGLERLTLIATETLSRLKRPIVIGIGGGSAAGKSDASKKFVQGLADTAVILPMDYYHYGRDYVEANGINFDQPASFNMPLFSKDLQALRAGNPVRIEFYKYGASAPKEMLELTSVVLLPHPIIVADGLFSLDPSLKDEMDIKVFVDADFYVRMMRRLWRDVVRARKKPADILEYFLTITNPMHERYVETTKANADMVIRNEYTPRVESQRSGLHEFQLKFSGTLDEEILRRLGAEKLETVDQLDTYFNPIGRELSESGESLRIRREGNRRTFTYKGPKSEGPFLERPKFEFEITEPMENLLLSTYGQSVNTVEKHRTSYQLEGMIVSLDTVKDLGDFIEIKPNNGAAGIEAVESVLEKLDLNLADNISTPYGFM